MTQESDVDVQAEISQNATEAKKKKELKRDSEGRIDSRLPLDAGLFFDIKEIAEIRRMSKIALITQYVIEGYAKDLLTHRHLLQSKNFTPKYVKAFNAIESISSGKTRAVLPEEISQALLEEEPDRKPILGSDD